jgi:hypothetical protein
MSVLSSSLQAKPPRLSLALQHLLNKLSLSPVDAPLLHGWLAVADTGATNHMVPNKSCFISYKSVSSLSVCMGNNSYVPVLGCSTAIFALNGKQILARNVLHVLGLAVPLYSLHTHFTQHGCGFLRTRESGFLIYYPTFILSIDMAVDCHLSFDPLGHSAPLHTLHYVQPQCPPATYPSKVSLALSTATPSPASLEVIEDNDDLPYLLMAAPPIQSSSKPPNKLNIGSLSTHLKRLTNAVHHLTSSTQQQTHSSSTPLPLDPAIEPPSNPTSKLATCLLPTMSSEDIARLVHHPGTSFPSVWPCDTASASNTKTHCTVEELHCIMVCQKFRNYKHLLQVSRDGEWVDGGKIPSSLGSYTTIPKAKRGGALNHTKYFYLDAIHMDIAFGDCILVDGFFNTLILVNHATQYNWTFGLQTLSSEDIILALCLFCAVAGSLACCFYLDCDQKLFGLAVSEYLIDGHSKVVAAPAKCQSANGLVK